MLCTDNTELIPLDAAGGKKMVKIFDFLKSGKIHSGIGKISQMKFHLNLN